MPGPIVSDADKVVRWLEDLLALYAAPDLCVPGADRVLCPLVCPTALRRRARR